MQSFFHVGAMKLTTAGAVTDTPMTGVADGILTVAADGNFLMPSTAQLYAVASLGATLQRTRINMPSLRQIGLPSAAPFMVGATVTSPPNLFKAFDYPIPMPKVDEFGIDLSDSAADTAFVGCWFMFGWRQHPIGPKYRIRFTATITQSAGTWVNGALTPSTQLATGTYVVCGMHCVAANGFLARLSFPGGGWRPGVLCCNAETGVPDPSFLDGSYGAFGSFENANLPSLDIFAVGAGAAQEVFLDLVRIGDVGTPF